MELAMQAEDTSAGSAQRQLAHRKRTTSLGSASDAAYATRAERPSQGDEPQDASAGTQRSTSEGRGNDVGLPTFVTGRCESAPLERGRKGRSALIMPPRESSWSAGDPSHGTYKLPQPKGVIPAQHFASNSPRPVESAEGRNESASFLADSDTGQPIDSLLLEAMTVAKDRILLLRSDLELERFINDSSRTRLRIAPPAFPPSLNSYQRLLVHRLADMWHVTRELEPPATTASVPGTSKVIYNGLYTPGLPPSHNSQINPGSTISGTIVLVKNVNTAFPHVRMADLVPSGGLNSQDPLSLSQASVARVDENHLEVVEGLAGAVHSLAGLSLVASAAQPASVTTPTPLSPAPIRIMSRQAAAAMASSSTSSPIPRTHSGSSSATSGMTFEEREAAYAQARMRIFNEGQANEARQSDGSAGGTETTSPAPSGAPYKPYHPPFSQSSEYQMHQPSLHHFPNRADSDIQRNLSPSAPVFVYSPVPFGSAGTHHPDHTHVSLHSQAYPQHPEYAAVPAVGGIPHSRDWQSAGYQTPPIQVTLPSPHIAHAAAGYAGPSALSSRPDSAHSHSSHSSMSTTTSASVSSVRTASTSSNAHGNAATHIHPHSDARLHRQMSGPYVAQRQQRPSLAGTNTPSSSANSAKSRHSHSSSSASAETSVSGSQSVLSASMSEVSKGKAREVFSSTQLPGPHPSLPRRPSWISSNRSTAPSTRSGLASSSGSAAPSISGKSSISVSSSSPPSTFSVDDDGDTDDKSPSRKEVTDTYLNVEGSDALQSPEKPRLEGEAGKEISHLPPLTEANLDSREKNGVSLHASPTQITGAAIKERERATTVTRVTSSHDGGGAQTDATDGKTSLKPSTQPKIVEYPPLRYDPAKGWTALTPGTPKSPTTGSQTGTSLVRGSTITRSSMGSVPSVSQRNRQTMDRTGQRNLPKRVPDSITSSLSGSTQYPAPPPHNRYSQHPPQNPNQSTAFHQSRPPQQSPYAPHHQQLQHHYQLIDQTSPQPMNYASDGHWEPVPQNDHRCVPVPVYYPPGFQQSQPIMHYPADGQQMAYHSQAPSGYLPNGQQQAAYLVYHPIHPMQSVPPPEQSFSAAPFPTQPPGHPRGGMTAADILATGEMLYSYDIPRPVPRSGATLFDPNAAR